MLVSLIRDLIKDWRYERSLKDLGRAEAIGEISKQLQDKADEQHENDMVDRGGASDVAGCVTVSGPQTELAMGLVCPAPTPTARQKAILDYLVKAAPSTGLDVLATEWKRLDEGVRKARE